MSNVLRVNFGKKYEVQYVFDGNDIVAVTHPLWPFRIMRNGGKIALVCEKTDEPFGEIDAEIFNTMLMCWLMIDDPAIIGRAAEAE